jgi:hypothetical protein
MTVPEEANAALVAGRYYGWDPDSYDTFANDASTC